MGGRGVPGFLLALGRFSAGKGGERRVCGVLTLVENNTSAVVDGLEPAAFRRNPFHASRGVFFEQDLLLSLSAKITFVTKREFSMRHLCPCSEYVLI